METTAKTIVEIPAYTGDRRYKSWAKHLTGVDTTQTNGYAYQGEWLRLGRKEELPIGAIVILYGEEGSMKHHDPIVWLDRVTADGLEDIAIIKGKDWALDLRETAAALFAPEAIDREALEAEAEALRARLAEIESILSK